MAERTLDTQAEESVSEETTKAVADEVTTEETQEEQVVTEDGDDSLESLTETITPNQRKELETLQKKARDFDGLVAKKPKLSRTVKAVAVKDEDILRVLYRENEKKALRAVVTEGDPLFLPELVPDKNYQEIIGFLPRSVDRSSPEAIYKALRIAAKNWKEEKGIKDEAKDVSAAELTTTKGAGNSGAAKETTGKPKGERTFLKKTEGVESWYKKDNE